MATTFTAQLRLERLATMPTSGIALSTYAPVSLDFSLAHIKEYSRDLSDLKKRHHKRGGDAYVFLFQIALTQCRWSTEPRRSPLEVRSHSLSSTANLGFG